MSVYFLPEFCSIIRIIGINCELYLDPSAELDKQLKYADKKGIPYVIIIGPDEATKGTVQLKNMRTKEQKEVKEERVIGLIQNNNS